VTLDDGSTTCPCCVDVRTRERAELAGDAGARGARSDDRANAGRPRLSEQETTTAPVVSRETSAVLLPGERPSEAAMRLAAADRKKRPESKGAKRAREAQAAFGRANGLALTEQAVRVGMAAARAGLDATRVVPRALDQRAKKGSAAKSAQKETTVTKKTNGKKNGAERGARATSVALPSKVAKIVETLRTKDETRYAVKVWKFKTGKRSSSPAKYGLTPDRAAAIFSKVEAVV
jgi:hypothetical protein